MKSPQPLALLLTLLLPGSVASFAASGAPVSPEWAEIWRRDLDLLAEELPRRHPDLFASLPRPDFEEDLARLRGRVEDSAHHELVTELARIVAAVGDGHTRLTLPLAPGSGFFQGHSETPPPLHPDMLLRTLPIRLYPFSDGLFVERVAKRHGAAAGARVVGIGGMSAAEAIAAVSPVVQRDNPMQVKNHLPERLVIPEILHARGVAETMERVPFHLETADGRRLTLELAPTPPGEQVEWVDARRGAERPLPLSLQQRGRNIWFTYLEDARAVYCQYNEVYGSDEETLEQFAERLFAFVDSHEVDKLILDLRFNRGGNNSLNQPLLHGLIASRKLQRAGSLYTLIGRATFSAAMMFAVDLEKHTPTLFVGEPTGSRPNHYGDSRKLRLPGTGLTVRISSLYWQYSSPRDERRWIEPHLPAALSAADARAGRDPALEAILEPAPRRPAGAAAVGGRWRGRFNPDYGLLEITAALEQAAGGWSGSLDAPAAGLEAASLLEVSFEPPTLRFVLPIPSGQLVFSGTLEGDRVVGAAAFGQLSIPFVLERDEHRSEAAAAGN